jgi:ApaG protein
MPASPPFYYKLTHEIRITVRPVYMPEHSRPQQGQYVFAYFVRIENVGRQAAQLISRRWRIHDSAVSAPMEVEGLGVVGEQPVIEPGRVHEYNSFCVLKSPRGYMEGEYHFVRADDTGFDAAIPRFVLSAGDVAGGTPS